MVWKQTNKKKSKCLENKHAFLYCLAIGYGFVHRLNILTLTISSHACLFFYLFIHKVAILFIEKSANTLY